MQPQDQKNLSQTPTPAADSQHANANTQQNSNNAPQLVPRLTDPVNTDMEPEKDGIKSIFSTIAIIAAALLTALLLTSYVFQYYQVDGQSMETTLQNGDRLVVWKVPRTIAGITKKQYVPNRGDVVIFSENLGGFGEGDTKQLIKRVIALPGERVVVKDGKVTVFNDQHPEGFIPDQTLPYGDVIKYSDGEGSFVVADNEIFVCGDNRGNSLDSRYFGPIELEHVVGKLVFRILPLDKAQVF